ncbi:MAG: undecaprenyldiphospho-muramoylpentapeptide beta-N-acetylglucosaminyltransferase [Deltaproteobacteria bacterium]|nr:undecaprenyldiphospho-muramoylpentapeptide beta-N-acetylglucosaminyltransferase [Deltaproteobacteria bacterium]MCL5277848.1 undecaprenyldiphospho-muramoylpentapeptide beta-N-acetylglucosaminyltransferase [Deltaproteobacteria bacterium]
MRLIIAGGGSGGHFFPALAIMNEIIKRDKGVEYLYVGSDSGIESVKWPLPEGNRRLLCVKGFRHKTMAEKLAASFLLAGSLFASNRIIKDFAPDAVLGVGGYASFPVVMAAVMRRVPAAIHEQNSVPGLANRLLSRFVKKAFVSFETSTRYLPAGKSVNTGLPIRFRPHGHRDRMQGVPAARTILVLGGSRGAHQINGMVMASLKELSDIRGRVAFIHQTGADDYTPVTEAYREFGFDAQVHRFIDDMSAVFEKADIAISRAGASTLFELAAYGIPSILIPYPHAVSDHQTLNAREVSGAGGAVVLPVRTEEPGPLVGALRGLVSDASRLRTMSDAMVRWAKPDAGAAIVDEMMKLSLKSFGKAEACTRE